jgi:hypothetical protein
LNLRRERFEATNKIVAPLLELLVERLLLLEQEILNQQLNFALLCSCSV